MLNRAEIAKGIAVTYRRTETMMLTVNQTDPRFAQVVANGFTRAPRIKFVQTELTDEQMLNVVAKIQPIENAKTKILIFNYCQNLTEASLSVFCLNSSQSLTALDFLDTKLSTATFLTSLPHLKALLASSMSVQVAKTLLSPERQTKMDTFICGNIVEGESEFIDLISSIDLSHVTNFGAPVWTMTGLAKIAPRFAHVSYLTLQSVTPTVEDFAGDSLPSLLVSVPNMLALDLSHFLSQNQGKDIDRVLFHLTHPALEYALSPSGMQ